MARGLTKLQLEFAREWRGFNNQTEAMVKARKTLGVKGTRSTAAVTASKWVKLAKIREAARQFAKDDFAQAGVDPKTVVELLEEAAFGDFTEAYDETGCLKPLSQIPLKVRRHIECIQTQEIFEGTGKKRKKVGTLKSVYFVSKTKHRELLGKHQKLFTEKQEHSGEMQFNFNTGLGDPPGSHADESSEEMASA